MTCSDSNKKRALAVARAALVAGVAGVVSVALAQDSGNRYARLRAEADIITRSNAHAEVLLQSQQMEIASLEEQIAALDAVALDVAPLLQRMFDDLEQFVMSDVPFFRNERTSESLRLRDLMNQVDTPPAEKYRRLMEAYQIELEYGRTMERLQGNAQRRPGRRIRALGPRGFDVSRPRKATRLGTGIRIKTHGSSTMTMIA